MQALRQLHCCQWGWMRRGMRSAGGGKHCSPQMVLSKLVSKCYVFLFLLQCGLALHRKCMEMCQLECEHRKGTVFGVDLSMLPRTRPDEVPFVVLLCTSEIESRALSVQVLLTITSSQCETRRGKKGAPFCLIYSCVSLRECIEWVGPSLASKSSVRPLRHRRGRWTFLTTRHMTSPPSLNTSSRRYTSHCQMKDTKWMSLCDLSE